MSGFLFGIVLTAALLYRIARAVRWQPGRAESGAGHNGSLGAVAIGGNGNPKDRTTAAEHAPKVPVD